MKNMFLSALIRLFTNSQICKRTNNLSFCPFPGPVSDLVQKDQPTVNAALVQGAPVEIL